MRPCARRGVVTDATAVVTSFSRAAIRSRPGMPAIVARACSFWPLSHDMKDSSFMFSIHRYGSEILFP